MIRLALGSALALAAGAAFAHPAMTADDTTMRAAPSAHARPVQDIPAHAQIEIGERWRAASWRDRDGFVRVEAIAPNDAPLDRPRPYYRGPVVVGPLFGFGYSRRW